MKALIIPPSASASASVSSSASLVHDRPIPKLRPDYLLVRTSAIALNPTDWKSIASNRAAPGCVSGCDYAGVVEAVGASVTKRFQPGDRVCGCAHGANFSNTEDGAFAEYVVVKGDVQMKVPAGLSLEDAATVSLGAATVGQGLYQKGLKLRLPSLSRDPQQKQDEAAEKEPVLIYGGSTATGSLGIQFAKLSGYKVLTTCSPHNFDFVQSLGADAVFDYNNPQIGAEINAYTHNGLKYAWDTISLPQSANICSQALSSSPNSRGECRYATILPVKLPLPDDNNDNNNDVAAAADDRVQTVTTFMYTIFGEAFFKGGKETPASPEDFEFAKMFMHLTESLLAEGKLKTHPAKIGQDGLLGALKGMEDMKNGLVSGQKLVYRVAETP